MHNDSRSTFSKTTRQLVLPALLTAVAALPAPGRAQEHVEATPYGQPIVGAQQPALGLYLTRRGGEAAALRLVGGAPSRAALLFLGVERADVELPGGGHVLVGKVVAMVNGRFDAHGVFTYSLQGARFVDDRLFAQGMQPARPGTAGSWSAGLQLDRRAEECAPTTPAPAPPERILVEELAGTMAAGHLEAALDLALNSKGDALTLDQNGNLELPIAPCVTVGGKVAFEAKIERGEDSAGNPVFDVVIAADVAVTCGVGCMIAGANLSGGQGLELIWRYASTAEVARALRSTAILQAVGPRLEFACLALDTQIENIERGIRLARRGVDRARHAVRSRLPGRNNKHVKQFQRHRDQVLERRRKAADKARRTLAWLIDWVATERRFLTAHVHGYETHNTLSLDANISTPVLSGANLGASAALGIEARIGMRVERAPESEAMFVEHVMKLTRTLEIAAGNRIGGAASAARVVELRRRLQVGRNGLHLADSGTFVRVSGDGKLVAAKGSIFSGQAAVGGEWAVEMRLADLLRYSADAIDILLGDDDKKILALLRAFPIQVRVQGRYEAGIAFGLGLDIDGVFKAGIGCSARMVDRGPGFEYEGGAGSRSDRGDSVLQQLAAALRGGPIQRAKDEFASHLVGVCSEVDAVMSHGRRR